MGIRFYYKILYALLKEEKAGNSDLCNKLLIVLNVTIKCHVETLDT